MPDIKSTYFDTIISSSNFSESSNSYSKSYDLYSSSSSHSKTYDLYSSSSSDTKYKYDKSDSYYRSNDKDKDGYLDDDEFENAWNSFLDDKYKQYDVY